MPLPIRFAICAAVAAAALLLLTGPALAARVATLSGEVDVGRGEPPVWEALAPGDALAAGDRVRTGDDGRAEVVLGRATIRLYPNSMLRVPEPPAEDDGVELERGTSLFDVLKGDGSFDVRTPEVVVSVKGTRFSVSLGDEGAAVAVFRGAVGVRSLALEAAHEVLVREGFVASGADRLDLRVLDLPDPWDGFSGRVLPQLPYPEVPAARMRGAALEAARTAALDSAAPEVVARAAERHPEVRARVEQLERRRAAKLEADAARPHETADPDGDRARRRIQLADMPNRDAVADARAALAEALRQQFLETWMNNGEPGGGGGSGGGGTFNVTFVSGSGISGPDHVLIEAITGDNWQLDEGLLGDVIDGSQSLPSNLVTLLDQQGITDPSLFAQQMLTLFN